MGHTQAVKCLIDFSSGANVNQARTDDGRTPLYVASQNGHTETCQALLSSGANVNQARTDDGTTPL